ncbi:neurogenic locus notch homolog protein 3-like [Physella acuta]|uniref:neurogenic locus notch homolog protein 3-like n=1 Tax=Physella acuta TaxID=109671 RepID=UPI0027DD428D|nr:neurogenic locus notch homolog protein 3-like [Physella acuta]
MEFSCVFTFFSGIQLHPHDPTQNPCTGFLCYNGGTCTALIDVPYCTCPPGFEGERCEVGTNTISKPGTCPQVTTYPGEPCLGAPCSIDSDCPAEEKCCLQSCGENVCTRPHVAKQPQCHVQCPVGYICALRPTGCPPGFQCDATVPTCVPGACANCPPTQQCREVSKCPTVPQRPPFDFMCGHEFQCVMPTDPCGGCPQNQICVPSNGTNTHTHTPHHGDDTPRHTCVAKDACGGCPHGQTCQTYYPPCFNPCFMSEGPCVKPPNCKPISTCMPEMVHTMI